MRKNNIVGQAPEVIERIKSYEAMGYDEFSLPIESGMSFERTRASPKRFFDHMMPAFA
jgi:hypothetical protein